LAINPTGTKNDFLYNKEILYFDLLGYTAQSGISYTRSGQTISHGPHLAHQPILTGLQWLLELVEQMAHKWHFMLITNILQN